MTYDPGELVKVSIPGTRPYLATVVLDDGETAHLCARYNLNGSVHRHARQSRIAPTANLTRATPAQVRHHLAILGVR